MLSNPLSVILPADQADLVLIMIVIIPLSYLLSLIYNKYLFLALTMSLTIGFQSILFPNDRWLLWIQQQVIYLLVIFAPRKYVGHIIFAESFLALSLLHCKRMYMNYGQNLFDVTGIFMMQLFNYIGMGYNYQYGGSQPGALSKQQLERRIIQKPSYITYLGYVNFLPACLVGPVYQFKDFEDYLNRKGDYTCIPNTLPAIFKEGGVFLFGLFLYGITSIFPISTITQGVFTQFSLPYKFFYIVACITHIELKYVVAWSLGMIGMRASGITYNPINNKVDENGKLVAYDFGKVEMNNMTKFYLQPNMKVKVDNWNISIQWALRRYVYENVYNSKQTDEKVRKQNQSRAQMYTVMVSALWHGLYPGYFVSFFHWVLYIQIIQQVFRLKKTQGSIINKINKKYTKAYDLTENLVSTFAMTYFGTPFHLMTWANFTIFAAETFYIPFIALYIGFFLVVKMKILGGSRSKKVIAGAKQQSISGSKEGQGKQKKID